MYFLFRSSGMGNTWSLVCLTDNLLGSSTALLNAQYCLQRYIVCEATTAAAEKWVKYIYVYIMSHTHTYIYSYVIYVDADGQQ